MVKAPAGIEPTTFPLLGERTADYAKRPYMDNNGRLNSRQKCQYIKQKIKMHGVGFEPTPPKRTVP